MLPAAGFHEFAEFVAEDVGTVDSGLNSMVLASNNEMVLMPVNEPTFGTARKSQIQTYLEQNEGPGLQVGTACGQSLFLECACNFFPSSVNYLGHLHFPMRQPLTTVCST